VVTICTTSFTFTNTTFCPQSVFMCSVWISEQTAIISLYNINWLVCITETESAYCVFQWLNKQIIIIWNSVLLRPGGKTTELRWQQTYCTRYGHYWSFVNRREVRRRTRAGLFWSAQWPATVRCTAVSATVCLSLHTDVQTNMWNENGYSNSIPSLTLVFRKLFPLY